MEEEKKQGVDFRVFYFRGKERGIPDVEAPNLDIRLNHNQWMRYIFFLKEYKVYKDYLELYKNESFNILHAHTLFTNGYIAYKNYKKTGIPYIVAVRDTDINTFFKYRFYLRSLGKKILLNASRVIFISESYRIKLLTNHLKKEDAEKILLKSEIIPNGIHQDFFENINTVRKNKINKNVIRFITVGHVMKRKNQLIVCKALEKLASEGYEVEYLIVGKILDNTYFKKIEKYSFVKYHEFVDREKLILLYRISDIFIMPSITETFGLTYIEALTQKLPIIYTKGEGVDSYFKPGDVGEPVDSSDISDIICKIKKMLSMYEDYGRNNERYLIDFQWEKIINNYVNIYNSILTEPQESFRK
ncbi:glycosyltransferase family 4 protein [Vagococcus fluvialis]